MARDFPKGVSSRVSLGVDALNPYLNGASALSVAAWVNCDAVDSTANDNRIVQGYINGSASGLLLGIDGSATPRRVRMAGRSAGTDGFAARSGTAVDVPIGTGAWIHLGGVLNIAGDTITPYASGSADNGGAVTFGAATYTAGTGTGVDAVGSDGTGTVATSFDGRIAEVAIWTADIGAEGFAALADGYAPSLIRPDALVTYWPLVGYASPEIDVVGGLAGTITGTIAKADHPRIIYSRRYRIFVPAASGGTTYNENLTLAVAQAVTQGGLFIASPSVSFGLSGGMSDGGVGTFAKALTFGTVEGITNQATGILLSSLALTTNVLTSFTETLIGGGSTYDAVASFAQAMGLTTATTKVLAEQLSAAISAGIQQIATQSALAQLGLAVSQTMVQSGALSVAKGLALALSASANQSGQLNASPSLPMGVSAGITEASQLTGLNTLNFSITAEQLESLIGTYNVTLSMAVATILNQYASLAGELTGNDRYLFLPSLPAGSVITFTANPLGGVSVNITPPSTSSTVTDSLKDN